jgi:hypothetical protein
MSAGISVLSKLLVAALETGANVARNNNITAVENMLKSAGLFVEEVDAAMQENPALAVSAVAVAAGGAASAAAGRAAAGQPLIQALSVRPKRA